MFDRPYYQPYQGFEGYDDYSYGGPYPQEWLDNLQSQTPVYSQNPFDYYAKPEQPSHWPGDSGYGNNPVPQPGTNVMNGLVTYFQDEDGQVDLDKMLTTAGKFANTVQQISPLVKQLSSFVKNLK